ncbi:serine hydrolase domain-containing protein [Aquimarina pacifica]|uniref:serine hydrolase domain-containing protein n=1 Tax=Aquimarina pacifica TaxID=1296415 RepID=UPI000471F8D4|nr:serine hydrolase domain-containing protein [Aquimarina pacifica]
MRNFYIQYIVLVCLFVGMSINLNAQKSDFSKLSDIQEKEIYSIFSILDSVHKPGAAVAIISKGELVYKKGFGMANLEYQIPITPQTKFQIAAMSRHFTAFAILMLEEEGVINLTDDIKKFIPELIEYDKKITIEHLLSQSDGLCGYIPLKELGGWDTTVFNQKHAIQLLSKQKKLGFDPGSDFAYTDTSMLLLAEVIARASDMSFAKFMKERLFEPLKMNNTLIREDFGQIISDAAISYEVNENGGYKKSTMFLSTIGATNMFSTVEDLVKWELHLKKPVLVSQKVITRLHSFIKLKNGKEYNVPWGKLTYGQQYVHKERGINTAYLGGSMAGHASSIFKFDEQDFIVIVLSNTGETYTGYYGMQSAYSFLKDKFTEPITVDFTKIPTKKLTVKELNRYTGSYWDEKYGLSRKIEVKNDTLRYIRTNGYESSLIPLGNDNFQMKVTGDDKIYVSFEVKNTTDKKMTFTIGEADPFLMEYYVPSKYTDKEYNQFVGAYYCEMLDVVYHVDIEDNKLVFDNVRSGKTIFSHIKENTFSGNHEFLSNIQIIKDTSGRITGFFVKYETLHDLWFKKIVE